MFQLDKQEASIKSVTLRIERHGDERRLATSIGFSLSASNEVLDSFDPTLRQDLFRKPGSGEQQELPTIGADRLTEVKHPALKPLSVSHEVKGWELHIDGLLEAGALVVLVDVSLKKFTFDPKEGGSVVTTFTANAEIESSEAEELADALVRKDVLLTLIAPKRAAGGEDLTEDDEAAASEARQLEGAAAGDLERAA